MGFWTAGAGNLISGQYPYDGVLITGSLADNNNVYGNYIGINAAGTASLPNYLGVRVTAGAKFNEIGHSFTGGRNVISGNYCSAVLIDGAGSDSTQIHGNYIGTDPAGTTPIKNSTNDENDPCDAVGIFGGTGTTVGGSSSADRNVISGNGFWGVAINSSVGNTVTRNYIGLDATGTAALGNSGMSGGGGVYTFNASGNNIGDGAGSGNYISGNPTGVCIISGSSNQIEYNVIGLDINNTPRPNGTGVNLATVASLSQNTISGNT